MYVTKIVMSSSLVHLFMAGRLCTTALATVRVFRFLFLYCAQYKQDTATQREYRHLLVICSLFRRNPNQQYTLSPQRQSTSSPRASQAEHGTVTPKLILSSFSLGVSPAVVLALAVIDTKRPDIASTVKKSVQVLKQFLGNKEALLDNEVRWLASINARCVLSDAAFLGWYESRRLVFFANAPHSFAAKAAGVPSILITNFSFDSVYSYLATSFTDQSPYSTAKSRYPCPRYTCPRGRTHAFGRANPLRLSLCRPSSSTYREYTHTVVFFPAISTCVYLG